MGNLAVSSAPVILLNGERLLNTRAVAPDKLVAFLPDRSRLKASNTVAVLWVGRPGTQTQRPLTIKAADAGR